MNTATALFCQTRGGGKFARWTGWFFVLATLLWCASALGVDTEPPAWQKELDALRLSDIAIALLPAAHADEAAEANRRLGERFRELATRYPRTAAVRKAAGDHFWKADDTVAAIDQWEAAEEIDPTDAETASALGAARLRKGQVRRACEQFQRAIATRPDVARYHFDLANVLYLFRHQLIGLPDLPDEAAATRAALAQFRSARDLAVGSIEFARAYAETFYGVPGPDWQEALAAWEQVRALSPDEPDFALGHLARVSLKLGRPDEARKYLAMIRDPRFAALQKTLRRQVDAADHP